MTGEELINSMISGWKSAVGFESLSDTLSGEKENIVPQVNEILRKSQKKLDGARSFIAKYALKKHGISLHKNLFLKKGVKDRETIEIILEDAFYDKDADGLVFRHQKEIEKIIITCVSDESKDFLLFFFSEKTENYDKEQRYNAMFWFTFLLIDLIITDKKVCEGRDVYLKAKLKKLLEHVVDETIIVPDDETGRSGYDGGIWEDTLFGWFQGEDRRGFVEKLTDRFNFDNRREHANRKLLSKHRKCMYDNAIDMFCNKGGA